MNSRKINKLHSFGSRHNLKMNKIEGFGSKYNARKKIQRIQKLIYNSHKIRIQGLGDWMERCWHPTNLTKVKSLRIH